MSQETPDATPPAPEPTPAPSFEAAGLKAIERLDAPEPSPEPAPEPEPEVPQPPAPSVKDGDEKPVGLTDEDKKVLEDVKSGKVIPHARFQEVNEKLKEAASLATAYRDLGTPEELRAVLEKLKAAPAVPANPEPKAHEPKDLTDEDKALRQDILRLVPEAGGSPDLMKRIEDALKVVDGLRQEREAHSKFEAERQEKEYEAHLQSSKGRIRELAEKAEYDVSDPVRLEHFVNGIANVINADKELSAAFYDKRDLSVVEKAFEKFSTLMFSGMQRKAAAKLGADQKLRAKLPVKPVPGGAPEGEEPPKAPSDMDEATQRALRRLDGVGVGK